MSDFKIEKTPNTETIDAINELESDKGLQYDSIKEIQKEMNL